MEKISLQGVSNIFVKKHLDDGEVIKAAVFDVSTQKGALDKLSIEHRYLHNAYLQN